MVYTGNAMVSSKTQDITPFPTAFSLDETLSSDVGTQAGRSADPGEVEILNAGAARAGVPHSWLGLMVEVVKQEHCGWERSVQPSSGNGVQRTLGCRSKTLRALAGDKLWLTLSPQPPRSLTPSHFADLRVFLVLAHAVLTLVFVARKLKGAWGLKSSWDSSEGEQLVGSDNICGHSHLAGGDCKTKFKQNN